MGKIQKKYTSGEANKYMTRKQSLIKLQLSLKMFRKLCIIKGIYPREPKNRKKAQKGATDKKTLYLKKDIQFLMHEPIVTSMREHKVFLKKKSRAKALRDREMMKQAIASKPCYRLDHVVKERYPTFIDAIRDLDDCLTLCFLFSTFPSMRFVPPIQTRMCRRLTIEFMHYVIEARALRKVFVSIKGYYYQAEIKGQTVTWICPHNFGFQPQSPDEVDFRIMSTFVEFYNTVLGFINYRLFNSLNIFYPPKLLLSSNSEESREDEAAGLVTKEEYASERVAALNQSLLRQSEVVEDEQEEMDEFADDPTKIEEMKAEAARIKQLKNLFGGLKFYLGREIPREPLTFVIRAAGGQVSWDKDLFPGATFDCNDESITHHIIDRPELDTQFMSRSYIQPQWVFDSFNARLLLPVENYFIGAVLPPHVSPFHVEREGDYVAPEKRKFLDMEKGVVTSAALRAEELADDSDEEVPEDEEDLNEDMLDDDDDDEEVSDEGDDEEGDQKKKKQLKAQMKVQEGKAEVVDHVKMKEGETQEQYRLRVMMIKNKHRNLYNRMMRSRQRRQKEATRLEKKRKTLEPVVPSKGGKGKKTKSS